MSHVPADRCLAIVELLAARAGEMPLGEIAEQLALPSVDRAMELVTKNGGLKDAGHYGPNVVRSADARQRDLVARLPRRRAAA